MGTNLYEKLIDLSESDYYPFHMPGHKRQNVKEKIKNAMPMDPKKDAESDFFPEKLDITEIEGFDNLHHTKGMLKEINDSLAALYGIKNLRIVVGGSTTGILSSVFAVVHPGDIVLMGRNCHMSVYHALLLSRAKVKFLYPESSGVINSNSIEEAFSENPDIKAVIITDPTYDGMKSDIKAISKIVHENDATLIVDAAHGAHLFLDYVSSDDFVTLENYEKEPDKENEKNSKRRRGRKNNSVEIIFPRHPINDGADIAISSLHKTLPALTGTSEILISDEVSKDLIQKIDDALDIFETSSPSYLMMASISNCIEFVEKMGKNAYLQYKNRLKIFYKETSRLTFPMVLSPRYRDPSKIVIMAGNGVSGFEIMDILRKKYHIELEEGAENYCLALSSVMDTDEGFKRLKTALIELNKRYKKKEVAENFYILPDFKSLDGKNTDGFIDFSRYYFSARNKVGSGDSIGKMAAGFVEIYPPGVPFIFPGLIITEDMVKYIRAAKEKGAEIIGLKDDEEI